MAGCRCLVRTELARGHHFRSPADAVTGLSRMHLVIGGMRLAEPAGWPAPFVFGRFLSVADAVSAVIRLHSVALRDEIASGSGQQVAVTIGSRNRHSGGPEMKRFVEVGARPCR